MITAQILVLQKSGPPKPAGTIQIAVQPAIPCKCRWNGEQYDLLGYAWEFADSKEAILQLAIMKVEVGPGIVRAGPNDLVGLRPMGEG